MSGRNHKRRVAKGVLVTLGAVLVLGCGAAAALWFRLGDLVCRRVERVASERFALEVHVADAQVGLRGVRLLDVTVRLPEVDDFAVRIESVSLAGSTLGMARRGLRAVEQIDVHGGDVRAHLNDALLDAIRARRSADVPQPAEGSHGAAARPPIHLEAFTIEVLDEQGALVRLLSMRAVVGAAAMEGAAGVVELGDEHGDTVKFEQASGELLRDERWHVSRLAADAVDVSWASSIESLDAAAEARLVLRLGDAARRVRDALGRDSAPASSDSDETVLERLTTIGFTARLGSAHIATRTAGESNQLDLNEVSLRRLGATRVRLAGDGTGSAGVTAHWNLEFDRRALRAEGSMRVSRLPLALVAPLVPGIPWEASMPGVVSADVEFDARGLDEIAVRGALQFEGVALSSPRLSSEPIRDLALRVEGDGTLRPLERQLVLGSAQLSTGGVNLGWRGRVEVGRGRYAIHGTLQMPDTSCNTAVHAIPLDMLGPLSGFRLSGRVGGRLDIDIDSDALERTRLDVTVNDECTFDSAPPEADLSRFEVPFDHAVLEPDGTTFSMPTGPGTPNWVSYGGISDYVVEAVVSHEDAAFFRHRGFAPWAIRDAVVRNLREGRYVVGASTITMQLAKNLFLHREKTLIRKVQEVLLTWWLERSLDKSRILELYLNVIEYGPSVYGLRNASRYYFGCSPSAITPVGAAFLAMILPAPKRYGVPASGTLSESMRSRIGAFLHHMAGQGRLDAASLAAGLEELESFRFRRGRGTEVITPQIEQDESFGANEMDWMP